MSHLLPACYDCDMDLRFSVFAFALLLWPVSASAQTARASAEDCAVLAVVGEETLKWREQFPDMPMYAKSYGVDCDFKAMGIKNLAIPPLPPGPYYQGLRFSFSQPAYSAGGLEVSVTYTIGGNAGPRANFFAISYCTAKKTNGVWHSNGCKPGPIT